MTRSPATGCLALLGLLACRSPAEKPDCCADDTDADTDTDTDTDTDSATDTTLPGLTLGKPVRPMALYSGIGADEEETLAAVDAAADGGFGTFIASVGGTTVWWNTPEADQDPTYAAALAGGVDLFQTALDEAHTRGLTFVPSVAVFASPPLYEQDPDWITRNRAGESNSSMAIAFSDPDARAAKLPMLLDLVCDYDVDGIFLDYTRYPDDDWGFDGPLLDACAAEGFDPRTVSTDSAEFARFRALRADSVTTFVSELRTAALVCNPDLRIAGFGGPDAEADAAYYGRDYPAWAASGGVDDIYLAVYYDSINDMRSIVAENRALVGDDVGLLGSLMVYDGVLGSDDELLRAAREQAVGGVDGLWVYRQDWLELQDLWAGTAAAQQKLERLLAPTTTWSSGWDARRDGVPTWELAGGPMTLDGDVLRQDAASGAYTSPEDATFSQGAYALALRGWPDSDIGSDDRDTLAVAWSDDQWSWRIALDLDGDLALPGDGVTVASYHAASGVRPDEDEPAWTDAGSASDPAFVQVDGVLRFGFAADADAENAGDYGGFTSPESPLLDMSSGGPGYRIEAVVRPVDDLVSTGYSYECPNIVLAWGDAEASYALCFDRDADDAGPGTTGSVAPNAYPIAPLIANVDWSTLHTFTIEYDGAADTFALALDDGTPLLVSRSELAGAWTEGLEGRVFFGDTTTGGHAPDYDSEWASVSVTTLGTPSTGPVSWDEEPSLALVFHPDDEVLYLYVDGVLTDWVAASTGAFGPADQVGTISFGNLGGGGATARWQQVEVFAVE